MKLGILLLIIWLCLPGVASASDQTCGSPGSSRAVILIHGGSFGLGSTQMTEDSCQVFADQGYYAINSDYPLGDLSGAESHLVRLAREARLGRRKVFAYGESAGGGLSALLSARALVDAAFAWAPVSDLYRWQSDSEPGFVNWSGFKDYSPGLLKRLSAVRWASRSSTPLLVVHGRDDRKVPLSQSLRLKKRYKHMRLRIVSGGHEQGEESFRSATRSAAGFFSSR